MSQRKNNRLAVVAGRPDRARSRSLRGRNALLRSRLISRVTNGRRVVTVFAAAGSGKSTLLTHVIDHLSDAGTAAAYLRCDQRIRGPDAFIEAIMSAVGLAEEPAPEPADIDSLAIRLDDRAPLWIITDDVHELDGSPGARMLTSLVVATSLVHWVVCGRRPQPDGWSQMWIQDEVTEVNGDDLRFRLWEIDEVLRQDLGRKLPPETLAAATAATDGWAAGVRMLALAMRDAPCLLEPDQLRARRANTGLLRSYLADHVFGALPSSLRRMLITISALDDMTAQRCDGLLETGGSARMLERLVSDGMFTDVDADGITYRFHPVLRNYLLERLSVELGDDAANKVHAAASQLLEADGDHLGAARCAARAGDWERTRQLLAGSAAVGWESWTSLGELGPVLGEADPWVQLANARRLLANGALGAAHAAYQSAWRSRLVEHLSDRVQAESKPLVGWCEPGLARQSTWGEALRAVVNGDRLSPQWENEPFPAAVQAFVDGDLDAAGELAGDVEFIRPGDVIGLLGAGVRSICRSLQGHMVATELEARLLSNRQAPVFERLLDGLVAIESREAAGLESTVRLALRAGDELSPGLLRLVAGVRSLGDPTGLANLAEARELFGRSGLGALGSLGRPGSCGS